MGTITITRNEVLTTLDNNLMRFAVLAGATGEVSAIYDPDTEILTVDGVADQDLQDTFDNYATIYSSWQTSLTDLSNLKAIAKREIDIHAGNIRGKFITVAPGQEMTYLEKSEEATDYVTAGYPADTSNYPFVQAEMDATGKTKEQAADDILAQKSAWITAGAAIEKHRLYGKAQVDAAIDEAGVDTAVTDAKALLDAV